MDILVNDQPREIPADWADETLLDVLREALGLTGTKFGCGVGICGACTVHVDGQATRACITPVSEVAGRSVRTIEGLAQGDRLHPVQQAWLDHAVPQCGYCQAGQIMTAVAFLDSVPAPTPDQITTAMDANLCRCGTYQRIKAAILAAAQVQP